jgi:hypothetical protein
MKAVFLLGHASWLRWQRGLIRTHLLIAACDQVLAIGRRGETVRINDIADPAYYLIVCRIDDGDFVCRT